MTPTRDDILTALERVIDPELHRSVIELDMVRRAEVEGTRAEVEIALTTAGCPLRASFETQVADALRPLGVEWLDMPLTPMRVWQSIQEGGAA